MTDKTASTNISIAHFSDVLCIWAYIAQIRIDTLKAEFGTQIDFNYHFLPVFGCVDSIIEKNWSHRGGLQAYHQHVLSLAEQYSHVGVCPDVWLGNRPTTCTSSHLFLKAVQLLEAAKGVAAFEAGKTAFESCTWAFRLAFFRDCQDISDTDVQIAIAEQLDLPVNAILHKIRTGEAHAALERDLQLKQRYQVTGSPTLIFNDGRQMIYGNVGYRVIQANVKELLCNPDNQASWC